jgi:hypothetical protein
MKKRIKFKKKDIGKTIKMYWCGHWDSVTIKAIEDDTFYKRKNGYVVVYNINLDSKTTIANDFDPDDIEY